MTDVRIPARTGLDGVDRRQALQDSLTAASLAWALARRAGDEARAEALWDDARRIGEVLDQLDAQERAADEWAILRGSPDHG